MRQQHSVPTPSFRKLFWNAVRSVTIPSCAGCHAPNTAFCEDCLASLTFLTSNVCYQCGLPLDQKNSKRCRLCEKHGFGVDHLWAATGFGGSMQALIHAFKYENQRSLALELVPILQRAWPENLPENAVLVPVPLAKARYKARGYNQSELLAVQLGAATTTKVDVTSLRRTRDTSAQAGKTASERRQNMQAAFACTPQAFQESTVILVDDVCTTGATLEACASACRAGGAETVWATTVARAI